MELTQEQIHARLEAEYPHGVTMRYVDYNDSLSDSPDVMSAIIRGDHDYINEQIDRWYDDHDTISYVIKEVFTEEEQDQDDLYDIVSQRCRDHDNEDPMKQLIKNTNDPLAYYDTWYTFPDCDWLSWKEMLTECVNACRTLGIHTKYAIRLKSLYNNAYYWWSLVIIINLDLGDLYSMWETPKYINFGYTTVGIINFSNGSWDFEQKFDLSKRDIAFPYEPERLIIDDTEKYGIQDIFWCYRDIWWEAYFTNTIKKKTTKWRLPLSSEAVARQKEEAEFKKVYREWWCSYYDADVSRHRKAFYRNDVPCWTKCPDCGRFRVD